MGIDEELRVTSKTIIIESPESSSLEIGDKFEDIKDYQLQAIKTSDDLVSVKNTVQTTVRSITTVSTELAKTAEVLQGTNATMTDVVEVLNTNLEVTNGILNELETLNKKLVRMNKRLALEV
jgi:ABC-type transporter Mla subunit MlaD